MKGGNGVRRRTFNVVSLYSGAMGLDLGLERTGRFKVLACVEKAPTFCATIRGNRDAGRTTHGDMKVYEADAASLEPSTVMAELGLKPGDVDLVVGGPPCQTFSTTGKRAAARDPRGGQLWRFLEFVDQMRPKAFVMENVRGLMSAALRHRPLEERPDKGGAPYAEDERPGSVIRAFVRDLHDAYRMDCFEVNAVNYGAPQLRERALFIGNRFNRLVEFPGPTHGDDAPGPPDPSGTPRPRPLPYRTLGQALEGLVETAPVLLDFSPRKKKYLSLVPPGSNWRSLPEAVARESMGKAFVARGGRSGWWRRLAMDLPCPTIVTMPNHASTSLCHPTETRVLSLRECARVQEFPDDWEFHGTALEQYTQVGNAVPVRLGKVAGEVVAALLDDVYQGGLEPGPGEHPGCRVVYVKSHVRTRQWFKAGETFLWRDGEENEGVKYGPSRTKWKVRELE